MEAVVFDEPTMAERVKDYKKVCKDLKRIENFTRDEFHLIVRTDGSITAETLTFSAAKAMAKRYLCKNNFADVFAVLGGKIVCEYTYDRQTDSIDPEPSIFWWR